LLADVLGDNRRACGAEFGSIAIITEAIVMRTCPALISLDPSNAREMQAHMQRLHSEPSNIAQTLLAYLCVPKTNCFALRDAPCSIAEQASVTEVRHCCGRLPPDE